MYIYFYKDISYLNQNSTLF